MRWLNYSATPTWRPNQRKDTFITSRKWRDTHMTSSRNWRHKRTRDLRFTWAHSVDKGWKVIHWGRDQRATRKTTWYIYDASTGLSPVTSSEWTNHVRWLFTAPQSDPWRGSRRSGGECRATRGRVSASLNNNKTSE